MLFFLQASTIFFTSLLVSAARSAQLGVAFIAVIKIYPENERIYLARRQFLVNEFYKIGYAIWLWGSYDKPLYLECAIGFLLGKCAAADQQ